MQVEGWLHEIGNEIRRLRGGEKQEAFADRVGLSRQELSIIENGSRSYGIEALLKILSVTRTRPAWLVQMMDRHYSRDLFDLLAQIAESRDEQALAHVRLVLETIHERYVKTNVKTKTSA